MPVATRRVDIIKLDQLYKVVPSINITNIKIILGGMPRIESGAAGFEVSMLPLCCANQA